MASFAEALYGLPTERLRILVRRRAVDPKKLALIPDKRQLVQFLSGELSKPPSVAGAILQSNARELRLLQLLVSEDRASMSWSHVVEAAGGPALTPALEPVMTSLEDIGLAFRLADSVFVPDAVRHQVPTSLSDRHTLVRLLNAYDVPTLRRICDTLQLDPEQTTKPALMEAIRAALLDARPARRGVPLEPEEIAVLEYVVQMGGSASAMEVASAVLEGRTDDFFRYDWQNRWKRGQARNAIDTLLAKGMLYVVPQGYGFNLFLVVPGDLLRILIGGEDNSFWTGPVPDPTPLPEPPRSVTCHTTLVRDAVALLGFVAAQEATRTNTGHIHKTSLKNLARTLSLPEERYASFLYAVARDAGLIAPQSEKQVYALTSKGNSWLHWDTPAQVGALFEAWRNGTMWGEMYTDPLKKANDYRRTDVVLAMRRAVLGLLVDKVVDGFVEIGSLTDALTFRYPLLLAQSSAMGPDLVSSPAIFVRLLVGECLAWLGLVDLGWNSAPATAPAPLRGGRAARGEPVERAAVPEAVAYRITPLGAYLLGIEGAQPPAEEPREDKFIVQANAEIFVPPYLSPVTFYHLLMLTETPAKGATGNTVHLTRESIRRALDQGETAREILAFLQGHARTGIPQNVEYLINEVSGKHGHIHIGRAQMYVQVDTPLLLKELQAHRELKGYFVRALSDTVALLRAEDPDKLLRELRKAGYLPVSDDAPKGTAFGARARPAPPVAGQSPPPTSKPARGADSTDTALDWPRLAQEDGRPWQTVAPGGASAAMPADAHRDKLSIKFLLSQAARDSQCVEIAYQGQDNTAPKRRIIEPQRVMGNFVNAYCRLNGDDEMFNINRIQWARLTGESFL